MVAKPVWASVTDAELLTLSARNPDLRFERNPDGSLVTMPSTGGISGNREAKATAYLLSATASLSGEAVVPGFTLSIGKLL